MDADREESGHSPLPPGPLSHRLGTSSGCGVCGMPTLPVKSVTSMVALLLLLHLRGCVQGL